MEGWRHRILRRRDVANAGLALTASMMIPGATLAASSKPLSATGKKVLIINAHQTYPGVSEGRLTRTLIEVIAHEMQGRGHEDRHTHIEQGHAVDEEVQKHLWTDLIVTQSPVFWFASPWIYTSISVGSRRRAAGSHPEPWRKSAGD